MRRLLSVAILLSSSAALCAGEIIDRIAVIAGNQVITQSEIARELRVVALLNSKPVDLSPKARREAAERLVEQSFIRREMEVSRYGPPSVADTGKLLGQTIDERFSSDAAYRDALRKYAVTEGDLTQHLQLQLMTIRFIDFRFRPGVQVPVEDVREYYETQFVPEWRKKGTGTVPPFEEARDRIEQVLSEERVDQGLDRWVNQQRTQTVIKFREEAFQ